MTITLSIRQRLHCMNLLRSQRKDTGSDGEMDDLRLTHGLLKKIRIPKDELSLYAVDLIGMGQQPIEGALDRSDREEPLSFEIETHEARKLKSVLKFKAGPDDLDWWDPLMEQLTGVK